MDEENHSFGRGLLQLAWYATFVCQIIMIILWISSFLSKDSSFYFKVNLVTGVLIFLINYFALRGAWDEVNGWNGYNKFYIFTGILMVINIFCLPVGLVYILVPVYMRYKFKEQIEKGDF